MSQKFFLFKRKDPSVSGGSVFSDNGKGISVISFPARNLAYMAASRGNITMYFNDSAPFEENSLTLAGESFEKTSVTVSCDTGEEADLMEEIINFINRDTTKNIMKFDATGVENTFGAKTSKPTIDARVRARPVERGLVGTDAIVTGLDTNAVVRGIDFLKTDNKPQFDFEPDDVTGVNEGDFISTLVNGGTAGTGSFDATVSSTGFVPTLQFADPICSKKTISFSVSGALVPDVNIASASDNMTTADLTDVASVTVAIVRGGVTLETSILASSQRPTFKASTDASANLTDFRVVKPGRGMEVGDLVTVFFGASDNAVFTVVASDIASTADGCRLVFNSFASSLLTTPPQPYNDHVVYMTIVRPDGALMEPVYSSFLPYASDTFANCMGPFPHSSLGNQFQFNYNEDLNNKKQAGKISNSSDAFSDYKRTGAETESSSRNLLSFVIRRSTENNVYVYDKFGELIFEKSVDETTNGLMYLGRLGMILPYDLTIPSLRIARFGVIPKDIGDLACRSLAVQLNNRYSRPADQ